MSGKVALFGGGGSGKTLTSLLLAIGISKELHGGAPIAFVDPEDVAEFIEPICAIEGVPVQIIPSRSFIDMRDALTATEATTACAFVVDHYDGIFAELGEAQKAVLHLQGRRLPYQHREELFRIWGEWVRQFRASRLHTVFNGRVAFDWGDDEDESGDPIKVKLGTKMRGEADAGYEPNLLIELEAIQDKERRDRKTRSKQGTITHWARVLKDRRLILNGRSFSFKDLNDYHAGDYKAVWKALGPHFSGRVSSSISPRDPPVRRSSASLFAPISGESAFSERTRRITIAVEELQGSINTIWPGQTAEEKRFKNIILETVFHSRSWTAISSLTPEAVEEGWRIVQHFEADAEGINLRDEAAVIALIASCRELERDRIADMVT